MPIRLITLLLLTAALSTVATPSAQADDRYCLLSFDSATLDVCTRDVDLVNANLAHLADLDSFAESPVRIVKFEGPIRADQRHALHQIGAEILGYVPFHAYLVRMPSSLDAAAHTIDGVLWTGPYLPVWKLDINLVNDLGGIDIIRQGAVEHLTIALHPGADSTAARVDLMAAAGLDFAFNEAGHNYERLVARFDHDTLLAAVAVLATHPDVASISLRWDNELMNAQAGWLHQSGEPDHLPVFEQGIFGCGQVVGALDTGLHAANCAFADNDYGSPVVSTCAGGTSCQAIEADFGHRKVGAHYKWSGNTAAMPVDDHGHGTHVMGSIAGNNPTGAVDCEAFTSPGGLTDLDGTAPGAKLISQEAGGSLNYLNSHGGTIYHAATVAYANNARIHNNSWGSGCRSSFGGSCIAGCQVEYRATTRDADAAVWEYPDLALFVAAGNSGGLGGGPGCGPGADVGAAGNAKNVFSIGANNRGSAGDGMAGFSSRGPTQDRRSKPDLTAQGAGIVSAARNACGTRPDSGTSMAAPTAAGLAALVREYFERGFYPSGIAASEDVLSPSAALVKALLINGAQEITGTGTTGGAPSESQGWGRINLNNALYFDGDERVLRVQDETEGLETGELTEYELEVESGQPLIVTLVWHDAPALVNANPHTVNRLRLEVETPDGEVWTQKLSAGGGLEDPNPYQETNDEDYDDANNVHQIRLDAPEQGLYLIRVRAIEVAQGPQPYALAATGAVSGLIDPNFLLTASTDAVALCAGDSAVYELEILSAFETGFDDPVMLSVAGIPAPAAGSFSVNPVTPADPATASVLNIDDTDTVSAGDYSLTLTGSSDGPNFSPRERTLNLDLRVVDSGPGTGDLLEPDNASEDLALRPMFSWSTIDGAWQYRLEVATDAHFANIVIDELVTDTEYTPDQPLIGGQTHHWRVTGHNPCGPGQPSQIRRFITANLVCSEPHVAIPDNDATGISDVLNVARAGTLSELRVQLDIEHTWVGDLQLRLSKDGTEVTLVDRPGRPVHGNFGCTGNDMRVVLDDGAEASIQDDCESGPDPTQAYINGGDYTPAEPLAAFDGAELAGEWTLQVSDRLSGQTGALNTWCLLLPLNVQAEDHIHIDRFESAP